MATEMMKQKRVIAIATTANTAYEMMKQERGVAIATTANTAYEMMKQESVAAIATIANVAYGTKKHEEGGANDYEYVTSPPLTAGPECACEYLIPSSHQPHPLPEATPTYEHMDGEEKEEVVMYI